MSKREDQYDEGAGYDEYGYEEGSRPGYSDYIKREANFLLALDYK